MVIVHLLASPFYGGPERQMLGLARHLPKEFRSVFLSFPERGLCRAFLNEVERHGFEGVELKSNAPRFRQAVQEVSKHLQRVQADLLCCSGYKPDLIGWFAARHVGIPAIGISHGWTAATLKVRFYEALDRLILRWMDAVVGVSKAQAQKVAQVGVPHEKIHVIRNAIATEAFTKPEPKIRDELLRYFPSPPRRLVGAAGRLSPEKGFSQLVGAAAQVLQAHPDHGFLLFGDGPLRNDLNRQISTLGLQDRFILAGFRNDLHRLLPNLDLMVLPSFSEGLPVILLEAMAAGVPVVATSVGGIPEVMEDGVHGFLVSAGDPLALAERIRESLQDEERCQAMGNRGRIHVFENFHFSRLSDKYRVLFETLVRPFSPGKTVALQEKPWAHSITP